MKPVKAIALWLLQVLCAVVLLPAAWFNLQSAPESILMFQQLGMEPFGRYLIGFLECVAALMLISNRRAATGALLACGVMVGAFIAHVTHLSFENAAEMFIVLALSMIITFIRRKEIPFIGGTL